MADRLEAASSGRARCRACEQKIDKGALRFGEELPGSYGEGEAASVFWFHPRCAAYRRPEKFVQAVRSDELAQVAGALPDREQLLAVADQGVAHPKLARLAGAELASSGRARCKQCQELIAQGAWRIRLSTFADTGFFDALGFVHTGCAPAYFEVPSIAERLTQAFPELAGAGIEV